jgi:hypothetical protein
MMVFALFSGILNIGISTKYPFIWYGGIIAAMGILCLLADAAVSLSSMLDLQRFSSGKIKRGTAIEAVIVAAVLITAASLRIWVIRNLPVQPSSDYKTYYDVAVLLSQGNLIKDGVNFCDYISQFPHVIGYPFFLSKVFKIFGASLSAGLYFNLFLSLISTFLSYRIARNISGKVGGIIALILVAFWPSQILYINHMATEPLFMCISLFSIWLVTYLSKYPFEEGKTSVFFLLNVALGLSLAVGAAVRPMSVILLIAIIICILQSRVKLNLDRDVGLMKKAMSKGWIRIIVIFISYLLCAQVISGSISKAIDRDLPGSSVSFGYNLLVGLNIDSKGSWNKQDSKLMNDKFNETDSAAEAHKAARDEALKRIKENPVGIINLAFEKYTILWSNDDYASFWNLFFFEEQKNLTPEKVKFINDLIPLNNLYYLLCVFLSILAGRALWSKKTVGPENIMILFFIGTAILHMILESQNRYHYNILPIFAILAAYGCVEFYHRHASNTVASQGYGNYIVQRSVNVAKDELAAIEEKPDVKVEQPEGNKFDMLTAIKEGHVIVTVTEAYAKEMDEREIKNEK